MIKWRYIKSMWEDEQLKKYIDTYLDIEKEPSVRGYKKGSAFFDQYMKEAFLKNRERDHEEVDEE